ncbi:hypothetical protein BH11MYX3_BH11MYX3_37100 [soil metagenome]
MTSVNMRRSQAILRMPVEHITATMVLHDGERAEVVLFLPPTEDIAHLLGPSGPRFISMIFGSGVSLVARDAVAALGVPAVAVIALDGDLPIERQRASVKLRSGVVLEGELRWTAPFGEQCMSDFLNTDATSLELHAPNMTHHIVKAHVARVDER